MAISSRLTLAQAPQTQRTCRGGVERFSLWLAEHHADRYGLVATAVAPQSLDRLLGTIRYPGTAEAMPGRSSSSRVRQTARTELKGGTGNQSRHPRTLRP